MMNKEEVADKLYRLNANISLCFIAQKTPVRMNDIMMINEQIGQIIKLIREIEK